MMSVPNACEHSQQNFASYELSVYLPIRFPQIQSEISKLFLAQAKEIATKRIKYPLMKGRELAKEAYAAFRTKVSKEFEQFSNPKHQFVFNLCIDPVRKYFEGEFRMKVVRLLKAPKV